MHFLRSGYRIVATIALLTMALGCSIAGRNESVAQDYADSAYVIRSRAAGDRKVVRSGDLDVSVKSLEEASGSVDRLVKAAGGYVENSNSTENATTWLNCRVPATSLDRVMDEIGQLGEEKRRSVSATDVTDQYSDLETRLRNNVALRDRLQLLLQRAKGVDDVLAIERELNRLQSEVESQQAQFDRLESEIQLSVLSVTLERERILGPLGYAGYGLWWTISKLFVIH